MPGEKPGGDDKDNGDAKQQNIEDHNDDDGSDDSHSQNLDEDQGNANNIPIQVSPEMNRMVSDSAYTHDFSIEVEPPTFGNRDSISAQNFVEPTDLNWPQQEDEGEVDMVVNTNAMSPRRADGSDDSTQSSVPQPNRVGEVAEDEGSAAGRVGEVTPKTQDETKKVHRKAQASYGNAVSNMSFFDKFGDDKDDKEEEDEDSTPPAPPGLQMSEPPADEPQRVHRKAQASYGNAVSTMGFFEKFGNEDNNGEEPEEEEEEEDDEEVSEPTAPPAVHRKAKESYGNAVSSLSFFEKFNDDNNDVSTPPASPTTVNNVHRKAQASYGNTTSAISFFDKFGGEDDEEDLKMEETSSQPGYSDEPESPPSAPAHRKAQESYGAGMSQLSFFDKFGGPSTPEPGAAPVRDFSNPPPTRQTASMSNLNNVRSVPNAPSSKTSKLISDEEAAKVPAHRKNQVSFGHGLSELSFSQKFAADDDDPPPVMTKELPADVVLGLNDESDDSDQDETISNASRENDAAADNQTRLISNDDLEELIRLRKEKEDFNKLKKVEKEMQQLREENIRIRKVMQEEINALTRRNDDLRNKYNLARKENGKTQETLQSCRESKIEVVKELSKEVNRLNGELKALSSLQKNHKCHDHQPSFIYSMFS